MRNPLARLDAARRAMINAGLAGRDCDLLPGYDALEQARDDALERLMRARAESLIGLQAKAQALLTKSVADPGGEAFQGIAASLARDLIARSALA